MQTHFTLAQLAEPDLAEADRILRACVHCGFCLPTCPTYVLTGDERDSPRGRIYLAKSFLESSTAPDPVLAHHLDRCLNCLACMSACPSGVDYHHLAEIARLRLAKADPRSWPRRLLRLALGYLLPRPHLFRLGLGAAKIASSLRCGFLLPRSWRGQIAAMARRSSPPEARSPSAPRAPIAASRRVILLGGCVQSVLRPEIDRAARNLLARCGIEVVRVRESGCCGALSLHLGAEAAALDFARRTIAACQAAMRGGEVEAILITASGCGSTVKDYGHLFRADPEWREAAAEIAGLTRDIGEYLAGIALPNIAPDRPRLRIAYHSACSLQHGQKIASQPVDLLRRAGFDVISIAEGHLCCGSAGSYNLLEPELAGRLKARKLANIDKIAPDLVAAGNIGCLEHLAAGSDLPFLHSVELLDWATGGERPSALRAKAEGRMRS